MMNRKSIRQGIAVVTVFACVAGVTGCQSVPVHFASETSSAETRLEQSKEGEEADSWKGEDYQEITFNGEEIFTNAYGAMVKGTMVTITTGGTYVISGVLENGRIVVDASKTDKVTLVWNGAQISCKDASPVYIIQADKTIFYLAEGTVNQISDGEQYLFEDGETEPDAAVFAKDDLTIKGTGSLTVNANYYDGIVCKNDLKITGGILTVNAAHQGIKGKDSLTVEGGTILVNAEDDGIKSSNEALVEEDGKEVGWVRIEGGDITIAAGDDAIHAESDLTIEGGKITITESYEGIEGACVYINGGEICLYASDDGINAAGYAIENSNSDVPLESPEQMEGEREVPLEGSERMEGEREKLLEKPERMEGERREAEWNMQEPPVFQKEWGNDRGGGRMGNQSSGGYLEINGGTIYVNAEGDGIDVNGSMVMNGGTVQIDGTESGGDSALDYDGTFEINGGVLVGVGNRAMAQVTSSGSSQYSIAVYFDTVQKAGSEIAVQDASGAEILSYMPQKQYNFLLFSSEELKAGDSYTIWVDRMQEQSVVLSDVVTVLGNVSEMGKGGFGGRDHGMKME